MSTGIWEVENQASALVLWTGPASGAEDAVDNAAQAAGYDSHAAARKEFGLGPDAPQEMTDRELSPVEAVAYHLERIGVEDSGSGGCMVSAVGKP